MAAALIATVAAALVVIGSLAGSTDTRATVGRVFVLGLPVLVATGATIAPKGIVWWSALLIAVAAAAGMVLAGPVGRGLDGMAGSRPALRTAVTVGRSAVAVILAAIAVRWIAPMVQSVTNLSATALAIVAISAAVAVVVFASGRLGLARSVLIVGIVVAVLALVVGIALGTPGRIANPVVPVPGPAPAGLILGLLGGLLAGSVHPGLSRLGRENPGALTRGALATAVIGFATTLGLALLSDALTTITGYISFAPSMVGAVFAGVMVFVLVVLVAAAIESALAPWANGDAAPVQGWLRHGWVAALVAGVGVYLIATSSFSGGWLLGSAGFAALAVLIAARLAGRSAVKTPAKSGAKQPAA